MADAIAKEKKIDPTLNFGIGTEKKGERLENRQKEDTVITLDDFFSFHTLMKFLPIAQQF